MPASILVVEDEEDVQQLIADVLKGAEYRVTVPVDSYVALERALDDTYGLITLDTQMPLLNGEAFARTLRAHRVHTPILLVADSLDDRQLEALDVVDIVTKPVRIDRLVQTVRKHLPLNTE